MASLDGSRGGQRIDIQQYYCGRTIFITGVTGFLGHVLLAKLLSTCPDIELIYVLMREKKGVHPMERFKTLFDNELFNEMKRQCPDYMKKVKAISGDCLKPNLGLTEKDEELLVNNVELVFHVAATVRFDAPLRHAARMNVRCTEDLIDLSHRMKRLQAFLYVSTAFSSCAGRKTIEEKFYDVPNDSNNLLAITERLDEDILDEITPRLLAIYPNTYVYTKAIAEDMCRRKGSDIPLIIFRPAIVVSTEEEPIPGWINNLYGPTGIVAGAGFGLIRSLNADESRIASIVPCDYVVNAIIAAVWDMGINRNQKQQRLENDSSNSKEGISMTEIYNFSNYRNSVTWKIFVDEHGKLEAEMASILSLWIFSIKLNKYGIVHRIYCILFHLIPAFIVDQLASVFGKQPRLREAYKKIHKLLDVLAYFSTREWQIVDSNVQKLWDKLSEKDKKVFYFNIENLNWKTYFHVHCSGIRKFIMKDPPETIPEALKRRRRMLIIHYMCITSITILTFYLTFNLWNSSRRSGRTV